MCGGVGGWGWAVLDGVAGGSARGCGCMQGLGFSRQAGVQHWWQRAALISTLQQASAAACHQTTEIGVAWTCRQCTHRQAGSPLAAQLLPSARRLLAALASRAPHTGLRSASCPYHSTPHLRRHPTRSHPTLNSVTCSTPLHPAPLHRVSEECLLSTHTAQRNCDPMRNRAWKIKNPSVVNPITGQPVSFKLVPLSSEWQARGSDLAQHASLLVCACAEPILWAGCNGWAA